MFIYVLHLSESETLKIGCVIIESQEPGDMSKKVILNADTSRGMPWTILEGRSDLLLTRTYQELASDSKITISWRGRPRGSLRSGRTSLNTLPHSSTYRTQKFPPNHHHGPLLSPLNHNCHHTAFRPRTQAPRHRHLQRRYLPSHSSTYIRLYRQADGACQYQYRCSAAGFQKHGGSVEKV